MTEETDDRQVLTETTALAWAAEGLIDSYEIAKEAKDTDSMIRIAEGWMKLSALLGELETEPEVVSDEGTGHYL